MFRAHINLGPYIFKLIIFTSILQVLVTYPSQTQTKVVQNTTLVTFLKALARGEPIDKLAAILYKDSSARSTINSLVCKRLSHECTVLCSNNDPSVLKKTSTDDLQNIDFNDIRDECRPEANFCMICWKQLPVRLMFTIEVLAPPQSDTTFHPSYWLDVFCSSTVTQ